MKIFFGEVEMNGTHRVYLGSKYCSYLGTDGGTAGF
jgi:hypothetical protein